ncbi:MAG: PAS domain S-box protein [Dehalococcoidia bacterium]
MTQQTKDAKPHLSILIVDDDEALAESLKELLEMEGYAPAVCHTGEAAGSLMGETPFDLVLVDVRLPDVSGVDLVRRLRAINPAMEAIIITGYATVEAASAMVGEEGVAGFWSKPIDQEKLLLFIEQVARRRQAEAEARSANELYRLVSDNVADVIWLMDMDMRFMYTSPSVEAVLGYTSEEMRGKHARHVLTKASFEKASTALYETISHSMLPLEAGEGFTQPRNIDLEVLHKDGSHLWVENSIRPLLDREGHLSMLLGISRDITERLQAQRDLEYSEASLARAQQIARLGSWEWDVPTDEVHWSDEMCRILGYRPGDITPGFKTFLELTHPEDREFVEGSIKAALYEEELFNVDHRIVRPDGAELLVHEEGQVEYDEAGNPLRFVGTTHDVTALKQTEAKLRGLSRRLLRLQEEERRALAQDLHDEVGQSVTVLKLLLDKAVRTAGPELRETIERASSVTEDLVRQIRGISSEMAPRMLEDVGLVPALLWQVEKLKEQTGIDVAFRHNGLDREIPSEVAVAAYRIAQEALTNAVRHSGTKDIILAIDIEGDMLKLWVEDHGGGFDIASMGTETSSGIVGMGERVGLLGGNMEIDTSPGFGTTLEVTLPL